MEIIWLILFWLLYNIIILPNFVTYGIESTVFALYVLSATVLTTKYIIYYRRPSIWLGYVK